MSKKQKKELKQILLALALTILFMILSRCGVLPVLFGSRLWSLILYLIPYAIAGHSVVRKAVLGIKNLKPLDESFLMFIATIGAFATGEYAEAAAVMIFYQIGEFFQSYAVRRSRKSIKDLMDIAPETANIENADGTVRTADPGEVRVGDILVIRAGEKIPVDGVLLSGESLLQTAALTGESKPLLVSPGDMLLSGCVNGDGLLRMRAEKVYEDSTVAKILDMVENASSKKSKTESFITRFARWYTPIVVIAAIALALIPPLFTGGWLNWIYRACTFLVISCPCALVISVPLAFFGGIGAASNSGVLVKGGNYLELLGCMDTLVTDKTGTLTEGVFTPEKILCAEGVTEEEILTLAAIAESTSTHPIASSILEAYESRYPDTALPAGELTGCENIRGQGIRAQLTSGTLLAGNAALLAEAGIEFPPAEDPSATIVYIAKNDRYLGAILISDRIKADTSEALAQMRASGVSEIVMLTGDRQPAAEHVAKQLRLDAVYGGLLPAGKMEKLEEILEKNADVKSGGKRNIHRNSVAFLGDGMNDAPVLSRADVGIAMGAAGSDAAIEAADVVIMDDNLLRIPAVIRIARKTVRISRQNIVLALTIKIIVLILSALGFANMWAAVFADVGVAVICILNSMRLLRRNAA